MPSYIVSCCVEHNLRFKNIESMHKHLREQHFDLQCDLCRKSFSNAKAKELHNRVVHKK